MAKIPSEIRSLAREHTKSALRVLHGIMTSNDAPPAARVQAATVMLERGWGKATQHIETTIHRSAATLSDDELATIATGSGEGDDPSPIDPAQLN